MSTFHKKTAFERILTYTTIGIQVGLTVGVGAIIGVYLDKWLTTSPWLTLVGLLVGIISGFTRLYQLGKELSPK